MYPRLSMPPRSVPLTTISSSTSTRSSRLSKISGGSVSMPPTATISIVIDAPVPGLPAESRPTGNNLRKPGGVPAGIVSTKLARVVSGRDTMGKMILSLAVTAPVVT